MPASKNLVGQNFGFLTVLEKTSQRDNCGNVIWLCKCNYCGKEVLKSTRNLKNSKSCGCYQKKKASEVNKQDITGQRFNKLIALYSLNEKDKDGNYYWVCQCDCGNKTLSTVHDLKRGHKNSCGCIKSKGELLIKELLEKNHIKYKEQYTFNDCINPKTNKLLIFDFYVNDNCCIEYDGKQHFEKTGFSHDCLEEIQYRDNIKNQYCKNNNIKLIRIPYWDFDKIDLNYLLEAMN